MSDTPGEEEATQLPAEEGDGIDRNPDLDPNLDPDLGRKEEQPDDPNTYPDPDNPERTP